MVKKRVYTEEEKELLQRIEEDENLQFFFEQKDDVADSTRRYYDFAIKEYCLLNKMTPTELLDEAGDEEDNNVHRRKRKIKARLLKYKKYMLDKGLSYNYMLVNYSRIKKFYTINEIKVPDTIRISRPKY